MTLLTYALTQGTFRTPGGRLCTFAYRQETNDYNTLASSLDNDEYHLPKDISGLAVDVGGYLGSVGIALALDNRAMRVVIVEPVPDNADLIERNIDLNGVGEQVTLIRGAVGSGGESVDVWYRYQGTVSLDHHAFVGNSSLAYDRPDQVDHETVTHEAIGLRELIERYGAIDYLKVDCEGGEWAFLDTPAVKDVAMIAGEAHAVRGHRAGDIVVLLAATHDVTVVEPEGTSGFWAVRR